MPRPKRSPIVMTSHADMGVRGKKIDNWFDELATLYYGFLVAAFQVVLSSPRGGRTIICVGTRRSRPRTPPGSARTGGDAGAEGNGEPERNRLPQLRWLFVFGRLRATMGPGE